MNPSLEAKALAWAFLVAGLCVGSAWLLARPIQLLTASDPTPPEGIFSTSNSSPEQVAQGREFYEASCSLCHGDDAHGDEGPDLYNLRVSNARVTTSIEKGIKGQMPSFAKKYNKEQVAALVSYLRTLR